MKPLAFFAGLALASAAAGAGSAETEEVERTVIRLDIPGPKEATDSAGGIIAADVDGDGRADRLYVADVAGDWREEIIVLDANELHVYQNTAPNPRPNEKRLWTRRNYRRLKQCHNYYSP